MTMLINHSPFPLLLDIGHMLVSFSKARSEKWWEIWALALAEFSFSFQILAWAAVKTLTHLHSLLNGLDLTPGISPQLPATAALESNEAGLE